MKRIVDIVLTLSVLLPLQSCRDTDQCAGVVLELKNSYQETIPAEQLFSSVKIVELQNDSSLLLNSIGKTVCYENGIYLTDGTVICHYDYDGGLISSISHRGRGPGEYMGIMDFDVSDGIVYVLDRNKKFLRYNEDGSLISETAMTFFPASFMIENDGIIMTRACQELGDKFIVLDKDKLTKLDSFFPIKKNELTWRHFMGQSNFFKYKGQLLYHEPLNNNVYMIDSDTVRVKYALDFFGRNAPEPFFDARYGSVLDIHKQLVESDYCAGIPCFAENDDMIIITYRDGDFYRMLKYDKHSSASVQFSSILFSEIERPVNIGDMSIQFYSETSMCLAVKGEDDEERLIIVRL